MKVRTAIDGFWISLSMIFLAEFGDKTQLTSLALASRFKAITVLAAVFTGTLTAHMAAASFGAYMMHLIPPGYAKLFVGMSFIGFGLWMLRIKCEADAESGASMGKRSFIGLAATFAVAELGDKTMLGTIALATTYPVLPVWIGSSLGIAAADGLAIIIGMIFRKQLPESTIKMAAACIFVGFGIFGLLEGGAAISGISQAGHHVLMRMNPGR